MPGRAPLSILVVDDSPVARMMLARAFQSLGHDAAALPDAASAWTWIESHRVDVILTDWPHASDGPPALVQMVRAREAHDGASFVFMAVVTPPGPQAAPAVAIEAGADAWIAGPADAAALDGLLALARRTLDVRRTLESQREQLAVQDERIREELRRDPLTRLGNRVKLDEDLRRIRSGAERYGHRWTAVMLDVDQCRRYNEHAGRAAVDDVLRQIARIVRNTLRDGDAAYRFGDDQFLLLLPEQGEDGGVSVAERCRAAVAALDIPHPRSDVSTHVTLSGGVAILEGAAEDAIDDWLRRADGALYAAKAAGRDGVARDGNTHVVTWGEG